MRGSIIWNIWALIFGFSLYFLLTFYEGSPLTVIIYSFITGFIFFSLTFLFRFLVALAFPRGSFAAVTAEMEQARRKDFRNIAEEDPKGQKMDQVSEANSEETAKIIRQMMNE